jgi:hypothetical protein
VRAENTLLAPGQNPRLQTRLQTTETWYSSQPLPCTVCDPDVRMPPRNAHPGSEAAGSLAGRGCRLQKPHQPTKPTTGLAFQLSSPEQGPPTGQRDSRRQREPHPPTHPNPPTDGHPFMQTTLPIKAPHPAAAAAAAATRPPPRPPCTHHRMTSLPASPPVPPSPPSPASHTTTTIIKTNGCLTRQWRLQSLQRVNHVAHTWPQLGVALPAARNEGSYSRRHLVADGLPEAMRHLQFTAIVSQPEVEGRDKDPRKLEIRGRKRCATCKLQQLPHG